MKKFLIACMMLSIIGCTEDAKMAKTDISGCENVRGVNDSNQGKVYYTQNHKLYPYINLDPSMGDRNFCSLGEAQAAGFSEAPRYFANSTKNLLDCLESESSGGSCHNYVMGVYQSLAIYDKVCAGRDIHHSRLVSAIRDKADRDPHTLDVDRYEGASTSFIDAFSCTTIVRKS